MKTKNTIFQNKLKVIKGITEGVKNSIVTIRETYLSMITRKWKHKRETGKVKELKFSRKDLEREEKTDSVKEH